MFANGIRLAGIAEGMRLPAPLVLTFYPLGLKWAAAAVMALVGLALYEHAYVQAGQSVPQS